jgi:hypothetical protein
MHHSAAGCDCPAADFFTSSNSSVKVSAMRTGNAMTQRMNEAYRRVRAVGWCAVLAVLCASAAVSQPVNVLDRYNGSFESGLDANWRFFEVPTPLGSTAVVTSDAALGTKAIKLTFVQPVATLVDRALDNWDTNVPVSGGAEYTLSVQAKTSSSGTLHLRVTFGFFDSNRMVLEEGSQEFALSEVYRTFTLQRTAPAGASYCFIAFRLTDDTGAKAAGTVFLDDVQLVSKELFSAVCAPRLMPVTLPSDDVPIASINVTEPPYNAKTDGSADATLAFQQAVNFAAANGGAVVFAPAGRYRFDGTVDIPEKVTLRGEWQNPDKGGLGLGTILQVYAGKGSTTGESFLALSRGSGVRDLTIFYPEQSSPAVPYPWTIECNPSWSTGNNTSVVNVTLINPYCGIRVGPSWNELHYIRNVYGTPLKNGIWLSETTDIGRIINVHFDPKYWSTSGFDGAPSASAIKAYTQAEGEGISMGRSDWEYISDVSLVGYQTGIRIFRHLATGPAANGVIYNLSVRESRIGIRFDDANAYGFAVTRSTFSVEGPNAACVSASGTFKTIAQFNTCSFEGSPKNCVFFDDASTARMTFQNCTFRAWGQSAGDAAVRCEKGSVAILGSTFLMDTPHLYAGWGVTSAMMLDNSYPVRANIINNSPGDVIVSNEKLQFPRLDSTLTHPYGIDRKPAGTGVFVVTEYGAVSDQVTDNTAAFQQALTAAHAAGGGTVYVPGGWWKISTHLTIPTGVELRGIWDVPHHTVSQGTVLLAYEKNSTEPFIALSAGSGIRGLTIWYPEQTMAVYPWTIQGRGADCWIKDVVTANSWQAVDMATYPTPNHFISYLGGCPLRTGVFVNNATGEGWVENVQFNSHYWNRSNGYPNTFAPEATALQTYLQNTSDAFRFGACANEHLFGNFVYAAKRGLYFSNDGPCKATVFLHGSDACAYGAVVESPAGSDLTLINSQLVVAGANKLAYIYTSASFAGRASFVNTLAWGDQSTQTAGVHGTGRLTLQQLNTQADAVNIFSGTVKLHGLSFGKSFSTQFTIGVSAGVAEVYGNYNPVGFGLYDAGTVKAKTDYNFAKKNTTVSYETGFESGEALPAWSNAVYESIDAAAAVGDTMARCRLELFNGTTALHVTAQDKSTLGSKIYFKCASVKIPVFSSSVLAWQVQPQTELGRSVHVDLLFTDGTRLTEFSPVMNDMSSLSAPHGAIGAWTTMTCAMPKAASGKTVQTILIGYNRAPDAGAIDAYIDHLSISNPSVLPTGWTDGNVGVSSREGTTVAEEDRYFLSGTGTGFMNTPDQFYFPAKLMTGDCTLTVRLAQVDVLLRPWASLGVMLRETRSENSTFAAFSLFQMNGMEWVRRSRSSSVLHETPYPGLNRALPMWLRLVRKGDVLSAYTSTDGNKWLGPHIEDTVVMGPSVYAGIALSAGSGTAMLNARLSNVSIDAGAWTTNVPSPADKVPTVWALEQNYPNPFNPSTIIRYDVPAREYFRVAIYDVLGRVVAVLAEGIHQPGVYTVQWNASSSATGMYIYQLQTTKSTVSKKMLLVR